MTGRPGLWRVGMAVYARDLRLAFRRWEQAVQPVVFLLMVATLFPLALSPEAAQLRGVAAGVLWVAALLASLLALEFLFRADHEDGSLELLVLSGHPLGWLAAFKVMAHWTLSGLPLVLVSPLVATSLAVPASALGVVMLSLLLGTGVLSFVGGAAAALTLGVKRGGVLVSVLTLPLVMPALIFGARAADLAIMGESARGPLLLLLALLVLSVSLAPLAIAAALRIGVE
ncbi:MAG: heme exporter protein CcmB [Steroidobacteraceae bacterium]